MKKWIKILINIEADQISEVRTILQAGADANDYTMAVIDSTLSTGDYGITLVKE
jgi:hypothetical protein